jgi:ribosomal-protein-alanine N-acetyltransferase
MVEVAYSVDPAPSPRLRDRHAAHGSRVGGLRPSGRTVRASVAPDNQASTSTLRPFGFVLAVEQWDEEDGQELVFERPVRARP